MEHIVELNHSLLSRLPLGVQSLLKSLPLSDFSIILTVVLGLIVISYLLCGCNSGTKYEAFYTGDWKRENKEVQVKVNTPFPKKNLKRSKRKAVAAEESKVEATNQVVVEEQTVGDDWEVVRPKKNSKKNE
jgi:hypothetical protein